MDEGDTRPDRDGLLRVVYVVLAAGVLLFFWLIQYTPPTGATSIRDVREFERATTRLVLREFPPDGAILFETTDPKELREFWQLADWKATYPAGAQSPHNDSPALYLYTEDGEVRLLDIAFGTGFQSNRRANWHGQPEWDPVNHLYGYEPLMDWLEARGAGDFAQAAKADTYAKMDRDEAFAQWQSAIPKGMEPAWQQSIGSGGVVTDSAPFRTQFDKLYPDRREQVRLLYQWYGSAVMDWSAQSSVDEGPRFLLLSYTLPELLDAIDLETFTPQQTEGAARLLLMPPFRDRFPYGLKQIPAEVQEGLLQHVRDTGNTGNLHWAEQALGIPPP